jgi:SAM-dependent methyltransferase
MKLAWDYTELAATYDKRPGYCEGVIEALFAATGLGPRDRACDVGAGTGLSTLPLLDRRLLVVAIEPNEAMRRRGIANTRGRDGVAWTAAVGEATGLAAGRFDLVVFGSSLNVLARDAALDEASRLLRDGGWVACLFNHRRLDDPLQARIEALIRRRIPAYRYGARREDHGEVLARGEHFSGVHLLQGEVVHTVDAAEWADAWRSHATLARQAGSRLEDILQEIRTETAAMGRTVDVPYTTRLWLAQKNGSGAARGDRVKDAMRTTGR